MSKFCEQCGNELSDDSRFCENCGATTDQGASQNQPAQKLKPLTPLQPIKTMQPITPLQPNQNRDNFVKLDSTSGGVQLNSGAINGFTNNGNAIDKENSEHGNYVFRKGKNFLEMIKINFFYPEQRLNRKPFSFRIAIVSFIWYVFSPSVDENGEINSLVAVLGGIIGLGSIISYVKLSISRLHDLGYGDKWAGLLLTGVFIFYLLFKEGNAGNNAYGADPLR